MGCVMGDLYAVDLILFVLATFAAAFVTGLAGFAFAIVAAAVWLHFLPPAQCTALIAAFGLIVQGWSVWKLRQSIKPARLAPFLIGGVIGAHRRRDIALGVPGEPEIWHRLGARCIQSLQPDPAQAALG